MKRLRVFTSFSGYDSQCMALDKAGIDYDLVGWSEIDKYAIEAHNAVYPQYSDRNFGDIRNIDWDDVPDFDLFTMSSPCQSLSRAGEREGMVEGSGTKSSLLWECRRAIEIKRPKYIVFENVKSILQKKFKDSLVRWICELESYGYTSFGNVVNAKDYVPQNRERFFMVSILGGEDYVFPLPPEKDLKLKSVLEDQVDKKYYLKESSIESMVRHAKKKEAEGCGFRTAFKTEDDIASCITTKYSRRQTDTYIKEEDERIRRLTEREVFRLMGVSDSDIDKIQKTGLSRTRQYELAGNSIVVDVIADIFRNLISE